LGPPGAEQNGLGRERVADIQRARILAAMVEVVAEDGAGNVTVAHIVGRSGVSRRTFYELFVDREDCFLSAFDHAIARIAAVVVPAYEGPSRWVEKIRAALTALLELLDSEPAAGHLVIVDALGAGPRALKRRGRVLARIIAAVDEGRAESKRGDGPGPMVAEGVVGGVLAVLHSRLLASPLLAAMQDPGAQSSLPPPEGDSLLGLTGPLMGMIVLPYLGAPAARRELRRPVPERHAKPRGGAVDPLRDLQMRLTYRTVRVLMAVAEHPGSSNRKVGVVSGAQDQGQISKLLSRLHRLGLIQNTGLGPAKGAPNAWTLTPQGVEVEQSIGRQTGGQHAD
jgi:AcrR family transcriptional regulator